MRSIVFVLLVGCGSSHDDSGTADQQHATQVPVLPEDMVRVPGGDFPDSRTCNDPNANQRTARAYKIDRRPVGCDAYAACVSAKRCDAVGKENCTDGIATVSQQAARKLCEWRSAKLPNSAQWQKAAGADINPFKDKERTFVGMCEPHTAKAKRGRCLYHSPLGLEIEMLQGNTDGEWTDELSCGADEDGERKPQAIGLSDRLDALVTPGYPFQQFRCVRME